MNLRHFAVLAVIFSTEQYRKRFAGPHVVYRKMPQIPESVQIALDRRHPVVGFVMQVSM
jgi:hypothetical protein